MTCPLFSVCKLIIGAHVYIIVHINNFINMTYSGLRELPIGHSLLLSTRVYF